MKTIILSNIKKNKLKFLMLLLPIFLYGCNTIEGAGTDIKNAGEALERSAEKNKECS